MSDSEADMDFSDLIAAKNRKAKKSGGFQAMGKHIIAKRFLMTCSPENIIKMILCRDVFKKVSVFSKTVVPFAF